MATEKSFLCQQNLGRDAEGNRAAMYLRRCDEQFIISKSSRLALILGALFGAEGLFLICYALYYLSSPNFNSLTNWIFLVLGIVSLGAGYRVSSPSLLSIDRTQRTYRGYRNWFPFRQQLAGSWEDFDHLSVKRIPSSSGSDKWEVEINWRDTGKKPFCLLIAGGEIIGLEEAQRRGVVLPERWDKAQAAAVASSPARFFLGPDRELEAHHQALVLASLLNLPFRGELKTS